jgi:serine phosphatase RsbU (regulator of sigma subunit)
MSLVVVDSDEAAAAALKTQLEHLAYDVLTTSDLKPALELCEATLPELVCCSDLSWAAEIAEAYQRAPVVLLSSAAADVGVLLNSLRSGLADVWHKPLSADFLAERIESLLQRSQARRSDAEARLSEHMLELQRDQRAGRYIQMGMLPPNPMAIEQYRLSHRILPSLILSGDFVDYFRITDRYFAFYVADVSGHGASSAFVTVLLKNFSRRLRREYRASMLTEPGEILQWINGELLEQNIDKHAAMIFAIGDLQNNELRLANAGHFPPAIIVRADGKPEFLEQRGKPVGLFEQVSYQSLSVPMQTGDRLVMFTDGILDSLAAGSLEEKESRLLEAAKQTQMSGIWQSLGVAEEAAPDDMTCLVVEREN